MDKEIVCFGAFLFAVLGGAVYVGIAENRQWNEFSKTHACKKVAEIRGDFYVVNGFDSKGNITTGTAVSPDKTGYLCSDGVTYYR